MKVLITGTSRGIGLACALKYLKEGHEVIGMDVCPDPLSSRPGYTHIVADITGALPEIRIAPEFKMDKEISGIQILVNNAGVQEGGREIDINLKGSIAVTEKYGITPSIRSIVFMASSSASNGAEFPLYAASKGGILAYMKNVALRVAKYGATCNSISAGGVLTPLNAHIIDNPDLMRQCLNETLLHKWASAEEIADLCYYLTCINHSMTGQDLLIDNGEQLKSNFIW